MKRLSWKAWFASQRDRLAEKKAEERWFLQKLHRPAELTELADEIAQHLRRRRKSGSIKLQSVWVDGLPQAVGYAKGEKCKCELADLLYVVQTINGSISIERAVLLQGKMAKVPNRLPGGSSTREERTLLESHEWERHFELYRAYKATQETHIGDFKLGGAKDVGFRQFARYLMIYKWGSNPSFWSSLLRSPYGTGWPEDRESRFLNPITIADLAECAVSMAIGEDDAPGQTVGTASQPDWDRLIWQLRNGNKDRTMSGYGGQPYVSESDTVWTSRVALRRWEVLDALIRRLVPAVCLYARPYAWRQNGFSSNPPNGTEPDDDGSPLLPVITVTITYSEG